MSTFISKLFFLNTFGNGRGIYETYRAREVFDFMTRKQPKHESVLKEVSMKFRNLQKIKDFWRVFALKECKGM